MVGGGDGGGGVYVGRGGIVSCKHRNSYYGNWNGLQNIQNHFVRSVKQLLFC